MTQQVSAWRLTFLLIPAVVIMAGFIFGDHAGREQMAKYEDPNNQTLSEKAERGDFAYAYRRNTSAEAMANAVGATKNEFMVATAYIIMANPGIDPEEAARQALFEVREKVLRGIPLMQE